MSMNIDWGHFITPFVEPKPQTFGYQAMGELGQFLTQGAEQKQKEALSQEAQAQKDANEKAHIAILASEAEGKNRYYDAQAETHRLAVEESRRQKAQQQASKLFDAFRKAKKASERQQILDQLRGIPGMTLEEGDTDLPDSHPSVAAALAPPEPDATETGPAVRTMLQDETPSITALPTKKRKGPAPAPAAPNLDFAAELAGAAPAAEAPDTEKFAPAAGLAARVALPGALGASAAPAATTGEETPIDAGGGVPDWLKAGPASPSGGGGGGAALDPFGSFAPSKPKRGGKWVLKDKDGTPVLTYDAPLEHAITTNAIGDALSHYVDASDPRQRDAAAAATQVGVDAFNATGDEKFAFQQAQQHFAQASPKFQAEERPGGTYYHKGKGGGGGGGGGEAGYSKDEMKRLYGNNQAEQGVVNSIAGKEGYTKIEAGLDDINKALDLLRNPSSLSQKSALVGHIHAMQGRAPNMQEYQNLLASGGAFARFESYVNQLKPGATRSGQNVSDLRDALVATGRALKERKKKLADMAEQQVRELNLPRKPGEGDAAGRRARARFELGIGAAPAELPPSAPEAAPQGGGDADLEMLRGYGK